VAKQIIIDWQRDNLLVAETQGHGSSFSLTRVSEQPIGSNSEDAEGSVPRNGDAAQGLKRAIDELGLRKSDVIVVASRDMIEVRTISIPRIDPAELPDVIRFQAQRQLANMGDHWTLDYVLLPEEPGQEMLTALVGVISPAALNEIETACAGAGVQPTHIALRPIEIARYATTAGHVSQQDAAMVLCLSQQDADLLILNRGSVVQVRGTKLPYDTDLLSTALNGELRRSLMAASSQLAGKPIKNALVFATPELARAVHDVVSKVLECPVATVDPLTLLSAQVTQRNELSLSAANRLAGLAGAANFASAHANTKLDFKAPKKRPPPKSKTTTYLLAAAAAAVAVLGGAYWWSSVNQSLDDDLAMYTDQVASQQELKKASEARIAQLKEVEKFLDASPNWLDEMVYLAEKIPGSENAIVFDPSFSVQADGTGRVMMTVAVDSATTIAAFEKSLRDDGHNVTGKNTQQLDAPLFGIYGWRVDETISIKDRGWKLTDKLESGRVVAQDKPESTETKDSR
jgi:Tfp pilus assembly PilM family ATPase